MYIFIFILSISTILALGLVGIVHGDDDVISLAGHHASGKSPQIVFINYFDTFPTNAYPHKEDGVTREIPPDERYLLPPSMTYMIYIVLGILSLLILFHLLRRRPIDHYEGHEKMNCDREEEQEFDRMRKTKDLEASRLYFYKQRTSHVATSEKLEATFGRDFNHEISGLSDAEYAKKEKVTMTTVKLRGKTIDDEEGI
ncbi:hypothetical protein GCK72_000526 [Caenorhabditis remanei]|uniref:Uncharacterized protein n=1 Tax=Caenorhabditis remanei TaxID=31234 RepID=A0A6A5HR36_CAERE|nr:hypothetical protein GCK72_000526 [Caenorhabditis remanei]KAF1768713.1 hypothetical protein GCK72_000526 [Caenorhabditis remanei]